MALVECWRRQEEEGKSKLSGEANSAAEAAIADDEAADSGEAASRNAAAAALKSGGAARTPGAPTPTISHILGELVWLLSQSPAHKHFTIGDLEWLVMPAILLEQFRVFHRDKHPLGFAPWAQFSEEAEKRFLEQVESGCGVRLMPQDWKSGDRLWLIEIVASFATPENKLQEAMLADLVENVFKGGRSSSCVSIRRPGSGR